MADYSQTRTRVLPSARSRNGLPERTEGREGRRSSVDSIIVGSAPRFAPCKYPRQRESSPLTALGLPGSRDGTRDLLACTRSVLFRMGVLGARGRVLAREFLFLFIFNGMEDGRNNNHLALPIIAKR